MTENQRIIFNTVISFILLIIFNIPIFMQLFIIK